MRVESFGSSRLDILANDINNFCIRIEKTCVVVDVKVFYCGHDFNIPGYIDDSYKAIVLYKSIEQVKPQSPYGGAGGGSNGGGGGHG